MTGQAIIQGLINHENQVTADFSSSNVAHYACSIMQIESVIPNKRDRKS